MPTSSFSNLSFHREAAWRAFTRIPENVVPAQWQTWLLDKGSLTQRLMDASHGNFRVQVLKQSYELPRLSEMRTLGMKGRSLALVREVILWGNNEPWVYARSIIPIASLTGKLRKLKKLDNRPLGALLFNHPSMQREPMEVACITPWNTQLPTEAGASGKAMWGRRSVFRLHEKPMLVSEIFLPTFKPYNKPLPIGFLRGL